MMRVLCDIRLTMDASISYSIVAVEQSLSKEKKFIRILGTLFVVEKARTDVIGIGP